MEASTSEATSAVTAAAEAASTAVKAASTASTTATPTMLGKGGRGHTHKDAQKKERSDRCEKIPD